MLQTVVGLGVGGLGVGGLGVGGLGVGGSGAAFTNLLFCSAGCQVLVLAKTQLPAAVFSTLAAHVGAELRYVTAESGDETLLLDFHEAFTIDPARIEAALSTWSEEPAS